MIPIVPPFSGISNWHFLILCTGTFNLPSGNCYLIPLTKKFCCSHFVFYQPRKSAGYLSNSLLVFCFGTLCASQGFLNQVPQPGWLKITEIYSPTILEVASPKSTCEQGYAVSPSLCLFPATLGISWLRAAYLQSLSPHSHTGASPPRPRNVPASSCGVLSVHLSSCGVFLL